MKGWIEVKPWLKRVVSLLLLVVFALNFAACSVNNNEEESVDSKRSFVVEENADTGNIVDSLVSATSGTSKKEETVYVMTNPLGKVKSITVNNFLRNADKNAILEDYSTLSDIEATNGYFNYTSVDENHLLWEADGSDISYQGTTKQELPITVSITYYYEGKEIEPSKLAGKSGRVRIHIHYSNFERRGNLYVPFTVLTGISFPKGRVEDIVINNGSVITMGSNVVIIGIAFPGLAEDLDTFRSSPFWNFGRNPR